MAESFNIYLDESCHLQNDLIPTMGLGAIWCPQDKTREISIRVRDIKHKHGLANDFELKWTKISPAKREFYLSIVDYFLDDDDLHFRGVVIPEFLIFADASESAGPDRLSKRFSRTRFGSGGMYGAKASGSSLRLKTSPTLSFSTTERNTYFYGRLISLYKITDERSYSENLMNGRSPKKAKAAHKRRPCYSFYTW